MTAPPTHWITNKPSQSIENIRYGHSRCLPVDIPQGYEQKMQQFTFDWNQLKNVISDEAAHFAVRTSPTEIRVFTRACTFSINLAVPYAQVSLDETIWMTELVTLHQRREQAEEALAYERRKHEETRHDLRRWQNDCSAAKASAELLAFKLADETRKAESWQTKSKALLSRCMKLVRKLGMERRAAK